MYLRTKDKLYGRSHSNIRALQTYARDWKHYHAAFAGSKIKHLVLLEKSGWQQMQSCVSKS